MISALLVVAAAMTHIQADLKSKDGGSSSVKTKLVFEDAQTKTLQLGSGELKITLVAKTAEGLRYVIEFVESGEVKSRQDVTMAPGEPVGMSAVGPTRELSVMLSSPAAGG